MHRPNEFVADGVIIRRGRLEDSTVHVPDGITWSDRPNPALPSHITEIRELPARTRVLNMLEVKLPAGQTRVLGLPVVNHSVPRSGHVDAAQASLQDFTGPVSAVFVGTAHAAGGQPLEAAHGTERTLSSKCLTFDAGKMEVRSWVLAFCYGSSMLHRACVLTRLFRVRRSMTTMMSPQFSKALRHWTTAGSG